MDSLVDFLRILLLALDCASHDVLVVIGLRMVTDGVDEGLTKHGAAVKEFTLVPLGPCLVKVAHYLAVVPKEVVSDTLAE